MKMKYNLKSIKGTVPFDGTLAQAIEAAIAMEADIQPAYGVSVEAADGVAHAVVMDGFIEFYATSEAGMAGESESDLPQQIASGNP